MQVILEYFKVAVPRYLDLNMDRESRRSVLTRFIQFTATRAPNLR